MKARLLRVDDGGIEDGVRQAVTVDQVTHFGRIDQVFDHRARETPEALHDAQVAIQIDDPKTVVSRNHALLYPPHGELTTYSVLDLNSKNGTFVNGREIASDQKIALQQGDKIRFGSEIMFEFEPIVDVVRQYFGLMVAHTGGDLRGTSQDLYDLKAELEKRGFANNIEHYVNHDVQKERICTRLKILARSLTADSLFIFYFSGHGTPEGELMLHAAETKEWLKLKELIELLSDFRGQVLVVLDGCYTAVDEKEEIPGHIDLIGHEGKALEGACGSVPMPIDIFKVRGHTSWAMIKVLQEQAAGIDVDDLFAKMQLDPRIRARRNLVRHPAVKRIRLPTRVMNLPPKP